MVKYEEAPDVKRMVDELVDKLDLKHVDKSRVFCVRSKGSKSMAVARIYGLDKVWQVALKLPPAYVIEVLSEKFDGLSEEEKMKVLLHELMHIPKSFSGGLRSHGKAWSEHLKRVLKCLAL